MLDLLELLAKQPPKVLMVLVLIGVLYLIVWAGSKLPDSVLQWFLDNSGGVSFGVCAFAWIVWGLIKTTNPKNNKD